MKLGSFPLRRLLQGACALSLLAYILVLALWLRSYFVADQLNRESFFHDQSKTWWRRELSVRSDSGFIPFLFHDDSSPDPPLRLPASIGWDRDVEVPASALAVAYPRPIGAHWITGTAPPWVRTWLWGQFGGVIQSRSQASWGTTDSGSATLRGIITIDDPRPCC